MSKLSKKDKEVRVMKGDSRGLNRNQLFAKEQEQFNASNGFSPEATELGTKLSIVCGKLGSEDIKKTPKIKQFYEKQKDELIEKLKNLGCRVIPQGFDSYYIEPDEEITTINITFS